jgi:hypothetical protein
MVDKARATTCKEERTSHCLLQTELELPPVKRTKLSFRFVYLGQWIAVSSLQVVALTLSTMDSFVLFTGGNSSSVCNRQWLRAKTTTCKEDTAIHCPW